jgi:hypothetical protein
VSTDHVKVLLTLMEDVEAGDPLDFGAIPLDEAEARRLVALSILKIRDDLAAIDAPAEERELVLMASAGHLVLENMLLHYQRLIANGQGAEAAAAALLSRLRAT